MSGAAWPATIGRLSAPAWVASIASCSMAAGRRVSSEASRTFLRSLARRRPSLPGLAGSRVPFFVDVPRPGDPTFSLSAT